MWDPNSGGFARMGQGMQDSDPGQLLPEDMIERENPDFTNPVIDAQPMFGGMPGEAGAPQLGAGEPGEAMEMEDPTLGPQSSMSNEDRQALRDLIQERAKSRMQLSEQLQAKARSGNTSGY